MTVRIRPTSKHAEFNQNNTTWPAKANQIDAKKMNVSAASLAPDSSVRKATPSDITERTARSGAVVETIFLSRPRRAQCNKLPKIMLLTRVAYDCVHLLSLLISDLSRLCVVVQVTLCPTNRVMHLVRMTPTMTNTASTVHPRTRVAGGTTAATTLTSTASTTGDDTPRTLMEWTGYSGWDMVTHWKEQRWSWDRQISDQITEESLKFSHWTFSRHFSTFSNHFVF